MTKYNLIATAAFGLESIVGDELKAMGYSDINKENGKIFFNGDEADIARCNINLRCADRVLIQLGDFIATDFEELFQGTKKFPWEDLIPLNGKMHVTGKSVRSKLFSVPDCQSIVKKAIIDAMKRRYPEGVFPEDGPVFKIEVSMVNDQAALTVDTSGPGLHKRGYRQGQGEAPLRETLAAALVILSKWDHTRILADPLCGSGTIPIEAAMIGKNIAPGLKRTFVAETWPTIPSSVWSKARQDAQNQVRDIDLNIHASDIDQDVFVKAKENAALAGVAECIIFQKKPVKEFSSAKKSGCIVCNPSYGERTGTRSEVVKLYQEMGEAFSKLDNWSVFVLTAFPDFEKYYRKRADKNRKLYNGKIKCYLYQYFGLLPWRMKKSNETHDQNVAEDGEE
jgi:putative N6-adenine-specific DNA methylase